MDSHSTQSTKDELQESDEKFTETQDAVFIDQNGADDEDPFDSEELNQTKIGKNEQNQENKCHCTHGSNEEKSDLATYGRKSSNVWRHFSQLTQKVVKRTSGCWMSHSKLDPFQVFEVEHESCLELQVTIHRGEHITKGSKMQDLIDTPDPYVILKVPGSSNNSHRTRHLDNIINPTWEENFKFYLEPGKEHSLDVTLMDANYTMDEMLGHETFLVNTLSNDIPLQHSFIFTGGSVVHTTLTLTKNMDPDLRFSLALCKKERDFLILRRQKVLNHFKKLLGTRAPEKEKQVPIVAVLGSGGGFRAMMCMSGAVKALHESGVMDCATYISGLSGSSWYISHLYAHGCFSKVTPEQIGAEVKDAVTSGWRRKAIFKMPFYATDMLNKYRLGQPISFTDFFGHLLGDVLLKELKNTTLTDQRTIVEQGNVPMPLYTCLHAKRKVSCKAFSEWVEFSPFEIGIAKYGTFMKSEHFGSKFMMGKLVKKHPESPLHFLQGVWGSAFTILVKRLVLEGSNNKDMVQIMREMSQNVSSEGDLNDMVDQSLTAQQMSESDTEDEQDILGIDDMEDDNGSETPSISQDLETMTVKTNNISLIESFLPHQKEQSVQQNQETFQQKGESVQQKEESVQQNEESGQHNKETVQKKEESIQQNEESVQQSDESVQQNEESVQQNEESVQQKESVQQIEESVQLKEESISTNGEVFSSDTSNPEEKNISTFKKGFSSEIMKKSKDDKEMSSAIDPGEEFSTQSDNSERKLHRKGAIKGKEQAWSERRKRLWKVREEKKMGSGGFMASIKERLMKGKSNPLNSRSGRAGEILNPFRGLSLKNSFPLSPFHNNYMKNESIDEVDGDGHSLGCRYKPLDNEAKKLFIVDSGLAFNSPYPLLLRPQRAVDMYLSFDFSYRKTDGTPPFEELILAEKWAYQNKVHFPPVEKMVQDFREDGYIREVYVFKNDEDDLCPVILHFPLVNDTFKTFKEPREPRVTKEETDFGDFKIFDDPENNAYASTNFMYENIEYERMTQLMEYNTKNCLEIIKNELAKEVERKKRKIAKCMTLETVTLMALKKSSLRSGCENSKADACLKLSIAEDRKRIILENAKEQDGVDSDECEDAIDHQNCESTQLSNSLQND